MGGDTRLSTKSITALHKASAGCCTFAFHQYPSQYEFRDLLLRRLINWSLVLLLCGIF